MNKNTIMEESNKKGWTSFIIPLIAGGYFIWDGITAFYTKIYYPKFSSADVYEGTDAKIFGLVEASVGIFILIFCIYCSIRKLIENAK